MRGPIIVGTDFRAQADRAADLFPDKSMSMVHAFFVPFEGWLDSPAARDNMRQAEQKVFDEFAQKLRPETAGRVKQHLIYGIGTGALAREIEAQEADLLVIGTHGESGLRQAMIGSTASELLNTVPADTLVITDQS